RVLEIPYAEADKMAKMIPVSRGKPAKLKEMIGEKTPAPEFKEKYEKDPVTRRWIDLALRLEGTNKTFGVHAAGVVISKQPLDEIVPLQRNNDGQTITQYSMEDVESLGLLKMDFLGLRNLTMIQRATDLIAANRGIHLDLDHLPLDDPKTYQILARGELEGIFQLESSGMKQVVRDLKPSNLEDISSVLALYRPGPLDTGMIPDFIDRKHGRKQVTYVHEILQPILKDTYGAILYQEQIMRIAQDMAGYSLGQADLLRRAMGKKKASEMEKHREVFLSGSQQHGVSHAVADALFDQMVAFAEYCLAGETPVLTLEYGPLPIATIVQERIPCTVFSIDEQGFIYTQPIAQWHDRGSQTLCEYTLADGTILRATPDHKMMISTGEMVAIDQIFEQGLDLKRVMVKPEVTGKPDQISDQSSPAAEKNHHLIGSVR
ncbi:MAG: DNA polymerase III subunit alpha, partial [Cyanophyceae cyanobacterium]